MIQRLPIFLLPLECCAKAVHYHNLLQKIADKEHCRRRQDGTTGVKADLGYCLLKEEGEVKFTLNAPLASARQAESLDKSVY